MLFSMGVSLYTSRVILSTLGVEDFGIYGVVGGVVAMFSFINGSMSGATSRFLTFELGTGNKENLNKTFSSAVTIHILIAIFVLILAETIGLWFLENKLVIPAGRMNAARWVYQLSIASTMIAIVQVPYNATIIAHERMNIYAYVEILNVCLKLGIVYLLVVGNFDKLILYAVLVFCVSTLIAIIYRIYCLKNFEESKYHFLWDRKYIYPMLSFSGWSLFGSAVSMTRGQGINILMNIFFGTAVNAANAIANQVNAVISIFSYNFTTSLNPQIVKSYAANEREQMKMLIFRGGKFSFFLLLMLSIPILLETDIVLKLWLRDVPEYAAVFTKLIILFSLTDCFTTTLSMAVQATGKIRHYQILVGGGLLFTFPIALVCYKLGANPQSAFVGAIIVSVIAIFIRLYFIKKYLNIKIYDYAKSVLLSAVMVFMCSLILPYFLYRYMEYGWLRLISVCFISICSTTLFTYLLGLTKLERIRIENFIKNKAIKRKKFHS